jgi:hypothetical protein
MTRVVGIWFIVAGAAIAFSGIHAALRLDVAFETNGAAEHSTEPRLTMAVVGAIAALLGAALVSVKPYRRDLGDRNILDRFVDPFATFGERRAQPYRGARSWWNGDPRDS